MKLNSSNPVKSSISISTILSDYAIKLREYIENVDSDAKVYIIGSVADTRYQGAYSPAGSQELSEQRSLAVLNALIKYGVPEQSVSAFGMSHKDPWHISNYDENDVFIEDIAAVNRKVVIVTSGDDAMYALKSQIIGYEDALTRFFYKDGILYKQKFDNLE
jgi:outer membrane protein OmpA-like peptidoglycan-associated protein